MIIYLLRHGEAEKQGIGSDANRALTISGREQVKRACEIAKLIGARPDIFICSPLQRAMQSAEIARQVLNPGAEIIADNYLEPESEPGEIYPALSKSLNEVLLVSHMPLLKNFIWDILGCQLNLEMKPGTMSRVDTPNSPTSGSGCLIWLIPQINSLQKTGRSGN
jgi:phosphohistidine phosphatase